MLNAVQLDATSPNFVRQIEVRLEGPHLYVKANADVLERAWQLRAIDYKAAFATLSDRIVCTASAIADVRDASKG